MTCKVANFHLAQALNEGIRETLKGADTSIRCTAPEAAVYNHLTIKSDVWLFGIVIYHIPYPGMTNAQVLEALQQSHRMPQLTGCSDKLYNIMLQLEEPPDL